jgi:hypothetical protein
MICTICHQYDCDVELQQCGHQFCRDCLVSYLTLKITDGEFELTCPHIVIK